ncbi:NAD(P)/FAD-dependent oxidoreductase [Salinibaculum rarum]|uniref:NAD(P)/FAD-dependent oxidoreductase n=1 Tax=Salinibaculum rarum TaxID=3058903 RepID=UPI00265DC4BE|nr:NAD(P)/FAD-dependent oxidoreductase [Salinibaculum sp. KK48]
MTEVAVVGGGLAGLVAARTLADRDVDVTLFERNDSVGGRVRSRDVEGFTLDRGFQVLLTGYPAVQRELDLDALDLRYFTPGATIARPGQRSVLSDPLRDPTALSESLFNREVTLGDKLRVLKLRRDLSNQSVDAALGHDDQSIKAFLADRGFSARFRENFAAPFYGGITLDRSLSTSRAVFEYTFKMLSTGKTAVPAAGMGAIPDQLARRAREAGAEIVTETTVEAVDAEDGGVTVTTGSETVSADDAIVATDPPTAQELTDVGSIPTTPRSCVTQHFRLPATQHFTSGRRLVLNAADDRPNQVAPMSAVAPELAPDDEKLLSATFLGKQDASDDELAAEVRDALASWYPENQFSGLELLATDRIDVAQFDQPPGFRSSLPSVDDPEGPVFLAGDYTEWSSIQGAMKSGRTAALAATER